MGIASNSSTVSLLQVANAFNRVVNVQSFWVNSGNTNATVTVPDYATTVTIIVVSGGGGGCDANPPTNSFGGGGGGMTYLRRIVTAGSTIAYNVGAGGAGGTGGGNGTAGGSSNVVFGGTLYESTGASGGTTSSGTYGAPDLYGDEPWSAYGNSGEIDGTEGTSAGYNLFVLMNDNAGSGGVGITGGNGQDGEVTFKWGACPIQYNRYTSGTSQTITAPADATFVVIKAWGGGGGGGANWSGVGDEGCGGGGGGFVVRRMPVTGGSTQFTYTVGAGGVPTTTFGPAGGNTTVSNGTTLDAGGGAGGTPFGTSAAGGIASGGDPLYSMEGDPGSSNGVPGAPGQWNTLNNFEHDLIHTATANTTRPRTYLDQEYPDGATTGYGGSGVFDEYSNDLGDPGENGAIVFEWYGKPRLTSYRANNQTTTTSGVVVGIPATPKDAAGYNGMIVESGTIDLLDLRDATVPLLNAYYITTATSIKYGEPASADAIAYLTFKTDGRLVLSDPDDAAIDGETPRPYRKHWLLTNTNLATPQTCDEYDVRVTKTDGADPIEGSSNNTWLNLNTEREWYVSASAYAPGPTGSDSSSNTCNVLVEVRRTDTDVVVANAEVTLIATATAFYGETP